jgi:hypothetical protein
MAVNATTPAVSIVGYRLVPPDQLLANPSNPRRHPNAQREALRASLRALGWIAPVVQNVRTGNLIDGHARIEEALSAGVAEVPVIDVDLSPEQEALALSVYDPITAMAVLDREALDSLLRDVSTDETALQALLNDIAATAGLVPSLDPMAEWGGMPAFEQPDAMPHRTVSVHFADDEAVADFARLVGQPLTEQTKSLWHPEQRPQRRLGEQYLSDES